MKIIAGLILTAIVIVAIAVSRRPARESELRQSIATIDSLQGVIHSLRETREAERERARHPVDVDILKAMGLENPISTLVSNLQTRSDLIPFQAPPGSSQFKFYDVEGIIVLDERFVFAVADDGHFDGRLLLQYEVLSPMAVQWTVVWADRD